MLKFKGKNLDPEIIMIDWILLREGGPLSEKKEIVGELFGLTPKMVDDLFEKEFPEKYMGKKRLPGKKDEYFCYKHQGKFIFVHTIDLIKRYCHPDHYLYKMMKAAGEL